MSVTIALMIYIFLAMVFYAVATLFISSASRNMQSTLAVAIVNAISALIPIAVLVPIFNKKMVTNHWTAVIMAILGGACIAGFGIAISRAYTVNKVGIVVPIVFGGAIFLSTILSYFFLKEKVSLLQALGLVLVGLGFGVITYARATNR